MDAGFANDLYGDTKSNVKAFIAKLNSERNCWLLVFEARKPILCPVGTGYGILAVNGKQ